MESLYHSLVVTHEQGTSEGKPGSSEDTALSAQSDHQQVPGSVQGEVTSAHRQPGASFWGGGWREDGSD